MVGRVKRFVCNRLFDFGGLALDEGETIVLERKLSVEGASEGTLVVAIHDVSMTSPARVTISVNAVVPDTSEPQTDYVGRTIASIGLDNTATPGTLRLDSFSIPWGKWVQISVSASHAAPPSAFRLRLTAELVLKSPAAETCQPAIERSVAADLVPWVLRARRCVAEPGPEYIPDRLEPVTTPVPPSWSLEVGEILPWLPRIVSEERCARAQECPSRPPRKVIEQVVTLVPVLSMRDDRGLLFGEDRHLEPSLIVPLGDQVAIVWEKWYEDGEPSRGGAVKPGVSLPVIGQFAKWTEGVRGQPRVTAIAPLDPPDAGEYARYVVALSRWPHSVLDLYVDVAAELLGAHLAELRRRGLRPRSVMACGTGFMRRYAIVVEEEDRCWHAIDDLDRRQLDALVCDAHRRGLIPRCFAEQPDGRFLCVVVEDREPMRCTPRGWIEYDVSENELRATLEAFACDGWRLVSALPSARGGLHLLWVEELWNDSSFSGLQFEDAV